MALLVTVLDAELEVGFGVATAEFEEEITPHVLNLLVRFQNKKPTQSSKDSLIHSTQM